MKRRDWLIGLGATALAGSILGARRWWPEQGLWNPCLAAMPRPLTEHEIVRYSWTGVDAAKMWDCHAHLVGAGDSGSGIHVNPRMYSLRDPMQYGRRLFFQNAGCALDATGTVDGAYVTRMRNLLKDMRQGAKLMLFAFERTHDERGKVLWGRTDFHVPDSHARDVARASASSFEWVASIHPYRRDCVEAADDAHRQGARMVKWLPAAMGIDPASPLCDRFYAALARSGLALVSHAGLERAVIGADEQDFGNPLRLRRALDAGVRVIVAHCATMGTDRDLDRGANAARIESFRLFSRMMSERRYEGRLFGDISAVTQRDRAGPSLVTIIERQEWHPRLLNGSDYPLPGVMPLFSVEKLVALGLLSPSAAPVLSEIRRYNPLLFDFALKRNLRSGRHTLATGIFETKDFFVS